jgi:hypothetical protein
VALADQALASGNADKLVKAMTHHVERLHLDATTSASQPAGVLAAEHKH